MALRQSVSETVSRIAMTMRPTLHLERHATGYGTATRTDDRHGKARSGCAARPSGFSDAGNRCEPTSYDRETRTANRAPCHDFDGVLILRTTVCAIARRGLITCCHERDGPYDARPQRLGTGSGLRSYRTGRACPCGGGDATYGSRRGCREPRSDPGSGRPATMNGGAKS